MSVTSGFFNSVNGDRKYNAEQMSAIFDGVINDGIFANIGTAFTVSASTNYDITVGIGRAWFNSAWIYNDAILPMTLEQPEVVLDRIDAVVIEVDHTAAVRAGNIKIVKGTPASTPQNPTMTHTNYVNQYPLAYIYRTAGSSSITQSNITSRIGTSDAPYITGILQVQNIDNIVAQWGAQWIEWYAATTNLGETEMQEMLSQWNSWYSNLTTTSEAQISSWMTMMQGDFESWFEDLQVILDGDVATALAARLLALEEKFDTLAKERAIYVPIEDSDNEGITDSVGRAIEGKTVFVSNSDEELARVETLLNGHIQDDSVHIITLIHEKTGTVHTLAGIPSGLGIFTAQFKATARFSYGDTFSDGYTAKPTGLDTSLQDGAFVSGDVVTVTIDTEGKKLNFKLGGGVNDTLPPLNPNMTGELADGVFTVTADKLPVAQADALAGAEWYYGDHVPARPGDGTKVEFTREQLITGAPEGKAASEYNAGDIVTIKENGSPVEFICLKHGYPTLDNGMTLFYRKNIYSILDSITGISPDYDYTGSTLDTYMEATYKAVLSPYVRNIIQPVNIAVRTGEITRSIFPLSNGELGDTSDPVIGNAIAYFASDAQRISNYGSSPAQYATRLFNSYGVISVCCVTESGAFRRIAIGSLSNVGVRPAFVLPSSTLFSAYTNELIEDATAGVQTLADTTNLGDEAAGSTVTLMENGVVTEFLVLQHGYPSLGNGMTLLRRKDIIAVQTYGSTAWYDGSIVDSYCSTTYLSLFSSTMQSMIQPVQIPCTANDGSWGAANIIRKAFILSGTELGFTDQNMNVEGSAIAYFSDNSKRIANYNQVPTTYYTRSPYRSGKSANISYIGTIGVLYNTTPNSGSGVLPCIVLPSTMQVNPDGSIVESDNSPVVTLSIPWTESGYCYCRQFPYNSKHQYQTQLVGAVATNDPDYGSDVPALPEFEYTGTYQLLDDGDGNWRIKFTTSGTLTLAKTTTVDLFLVGGGGGGVSGGGGGGYTATHTSVVLEGGTPYTVTIGGGGTGGAGGMAGNGSAGGATSIGSYSITGGASANQDDGGNGGSGGGGSGSELDNWRNGGNGGSDGANGATSSYPGGTGQGITTREFGETDGELYSGGGGGESGDSRSGGNGGAGGPNETIALGGSSSRGKDGQTPGDGIGGTGGIGRLSVGSRERDYYGGGGGAGYGGGGGGSYAGGSFEYRGGNGFQGIAVIRNHREAVS